MVNQEGIKLSDNISTQEDQSLFGDFTSAKYSVSENINLIDNTETAINIVKQIIKIYPSGVDEIITFTSLIFDNWNGVYSKIYYEPLNTIDPPENSLLEDRFIELINKYHDESDLRIPYQYIANIVYQTDTENLLNNSKDWDFFIQNLHANCAKSIKHFDTLFDSKKDDLSPTEIDSLKKSIILKKKIMNKIVSHFELSYTQSQFIKKNTLESLKIASTSKKFAESAVTASNEAKNIIENTKGKMYTEFVAILGIFSALMFGMISGFDFISDTLALLAGETISMGRIAIGSSALGIGLITLMYTLVQWIGHLIKNPFRPENFKKESPLNNGVIGFEYRHSLYLLAVYLLLNIMFFGIILVVFSNAGFNDAIYNGSLSNNMIFKEKFSALIAIVINLLIILIIDLYLIGYRLFTDKEKRKALKEVKKKNFYGNIKNIKSIILNYLKNINSIGKTTKDNETLEE